MWPGIRPATGWIAYLTSAPLLYNHNSDDVLGVVEKSWIEGRRGYVTVRLGKHERGEDILGLINDGILKNVSVGYSITKTEKEERKKNDDKEYTYNKSYTSYFDRPITYTDETKKEIFLDKVM